MPRSPSPVVLYEDNHLLVLNKPAGLATVGTTDRPSVYRWAGEYLKQKYNKPGNVFVGIVSRLDTVTSGVLVVARTSKGAARLSEQIRHSRMRKVYQTVVEGQLASDAGTLENWLRKDDAAHRMRVTRADRDDAQLARLRYRTLAQLHDKSLLEVELLTGRKHQIRVQMSAAGHPVWGDRKYAATTPAVGAGIALHSSVLELEHPTRREPLRFEAPPPAAWAALRLSP
ncbi:RluA family pseudouridine synthase [Candidatus Laterigemmans baculatus]|uniref:RluA family pseudouridine synthase n=1 Tax=Candidatus Laterigemmans baculatus TaxID=2770505 RepID=UPI0013DBB826|nr:RluA family pseudouridine synthase [Candidatus Laterigemmans baculatus]